MRGGNSSAIRATPTRSRVRALLLTAALLTTVAGSGCGQGAHPSTATQTKVDVTAPQDSATRILAMQTSGFTEPSELVLRNAAALAQAWSTVYSGLPGNAAPSVDFARESVVLLALGERSTGGYAIRFDGVSREAGRAVVRYTVTAPGPNCMSAQVISSPVEAFRVPALPADVRFERKDALTPC